MKTNKMLKWRFTLIAIVAVAIVSAVRAQVAVTTPVVGNVQGQVYEDSELLAQALLLHDTDHYIASLQAYNTGVSLNMNMVLDGNLFITNLLINNTNIPLTNSLAGIPVPTTGFQNVSIQITAMDKYGAQAAQGQFYTNYLAQGSLVTMSMSPQFPPVAIQLQKGLDQSSMVVNVTGSNGWGWSYDPSTGLLTISISDPVTTSINYTVTDGSGGLLAHGPLPFFQPYPGSGTGTNSVFDIHNDGNVVILPLGSNGYNYINNVHFDSSVVRNDQFVSAKVVGITGIGYRNLQLFSYNLNGGSIEVRNWSATGSMNLVPITTSTDSYGNTTAVTINPVDRVVVTLLPGKNTPASVYLYASQY